MNEVYSHCDLSHDDNDDDKTAKCEERIHFPTNSRLFIQKKFYFNKIIKQWINKNEMNCQQNESPYLK